MSEDQKDTHKWVFDTHPDALGRNLERCTECGCWKESRVNLQGRDANCAYQMIRTVMKS